MSLSDPIADMLTRIRNASRVGKKDVNIKASKVCQGVAGVLKSEGFINDYDRIEDDKQGIIRVALRYTMDGDPVIKGHKDQSLQCSRRIERRPLKYVDPASWRLFGKPSQIC